MNVCIGTDEAGYGPNLGPLVITATTWQLPSGVLPQDLWDLTSDVLTNAPVRSEERMHVADSKQVYSSSRSLKALERSVHAFLRPLYRGTGSVGDLCCCLSDESFADDYKHVCRGIIEELKLPLHVPVSQVEQDADAVTAVLQRSGISLTGVRSCIMFPPLFNAGVEATGSKGQVLSAATLDLVRRSVDSSTAAAGWIFCDKHGGRNRYDDIISTAFDDDFVFRLEESGPRSRYRMRELEFCFRTKAEELLPVALASMVAKYVREIVMIQFNRFWQYHLPELKSTKGYPVDAKRFWTDIAATASKLQIAKSDIWRCR